MLAHAVLVNIDRICQTCDSELADLAGVELALAPKKPPKLDTKVASVEWVGYPALALQNAPCWDNAESAIVPLMTVMWSPYKMMCLHL
jgi:hypothetical protein